MDSEETPEPVEIQPKITPLAMEEVGNSAEVCQMGLSYLLLSTEPLRSHFNPDIAACPVLPWDP